jgi:hypothetical protein
MTKYGLGTFETDTLKQISFLSSEEYQQLTAAMATLDEFMYDSHLFMIAEWNFAEFVNLVTSYKKAYIEKDTSVLLRRPMSLEINRVLLNFLSSARSYLDFMERLLKNRFGNDSNMVCKFKDYCAVEHDQSFSYRFLYSLRNYAQHKGFPINSITFGQNRTRDRKNIEHYFEVGILRDEILSDFDWRRLTSEVKKLPEKIDIVFHTIEFIESIRKIHLQVIGDLFHTLTDDATIVLKYAERVPGREDILKIFEMDDESATRKNIKQMSVPVRLAQKIIKGNIEEVFTITSSVSG